MDPALLRDPYPFFEHLIKHDPVHRADLGFWVVTRFDDNRSILVNKAFGQGDFVKNIQLFYGQISMSCHTQHTHGYPESL